MNQRVANAWGETFRSMHVRNFRLFFGGQLISQIGNWLTLIAQTLLVLKLTDSGLAVGFLAACQFLPVLLFGAWSGLVADRSDKRKLLMIVQSFAMLQSFALAFLAFMDKPPLPALFLVALAGGFATAFDNPARRAFVVEMVPQENVQNAVSLNSALMTGSRVIGPAFAGLLIATVGFGWCFLVDGLSYLAVLAGLKMMRTEELRVPLPTPRSKGQVRAGIRYARSVPELWVPLVMMTIIGALAFNFNVVMPLFVTRTLHGSDTTFTLLYSVVSVGSLIGALHTARKTSTSVRQVVLGAASFGVAMLLLAAAPTLSVALPLAMLMGLTSITFMTASTAIVQMRADPAMRGRVLALQAIVFLGTTPIGGPLLGWIIEEFGARVGLAVGGVACLVAAVFGELAPRRAGHCDPPAAPVAPGQLIPG
ncbi:MAG TPA: MFS transporter [Ilumatobacteraceae bacterium]|nr:MFS transporter [Ilumatobacteraceae bacterium]HRB02596.1 MFS transporter [Ilumatobacteraceae bacterium]